MLTEFPDSEKRILPDHRACGKNRGRSEKKPAGIRVREGGNTKPRARQEQGARYLFRSPFGDTTHSEQARCIRFSSVLFRRSSSVRSRYRPCSVPADRHGRQDHQRVGTSGRESPSPGTFLSSPRFARSGRTSGEDASTCPHRSDCDGRTLFSWVLFCPKPVS
jgi:hypothetical protein